MLCKFHIWVRILSCRTVYPKKYAHGFCFAVLCCGYTLTDFPIFTRLTSLALWQSNDCPSAGKATLMNMDKYFMWNHYERLHNHNKAKHNETVCMFIGIYCTRSIMMTSRHGNAFRMFIGIYCIWSIMMTSRHGNAFRMFIGVYCIWSIMMTSRHGNAFRIIGPLWYRWIALAQDLYCGAFDIWMKHFLESSSWCCHDYYPSAAAHYVSQTCPTGRLCVINITQISAAYLTQKCLFTGNHLESQI